MRQLEFASSVLAFIKYLCQVTEQEDLMMALPSMSLYSPLSLPVPSLTESSSSSEYYSSPESYSSPDPSLSSPSQAFLNTPSPQTFPTSPFNIDDIDDVIFDEIMLSQYVQ